MWNGVGDSFSQFLNDGSVSNLSAQDYGVFRDVAEFYEKIGGSDELRGLNRVLIPLFIGSATRKVSALRE